MIKVENLKKIYKVGNEKIVALNDINLEIEQGEFCCIVGTSGSGKSTLLNQLAGLEKPSKGSVTIDGQNISKMTEKQLAIFRQNTIGFIFQSYNLMPTLTAVENVAFPLMFKGIDRKIREKKARAILKEMQLGERMEHKPTELSGGQQQRVGIARAFVGKPKVIFADEPTGNLDSKTTAQVMNMLTEISRRNGITFVMVTHDPELAKLAQRIVTLKDGSIISDTKGEKTLPAAEKQEAQEAALPPDDSDDSTQDNGVKTDDIKQEPQTNQNNVEGKNEKK
ncbi:MAG: ABC transporter ATP-binding protein [Oscillospiraceae bacterium]